MGCPDQAPATTEVFFGSGRGREYRHLRPRGFTMLRSRNLQAIRGRQAIGLVPRLAQEHTQGTHVHARHAWTVALQHTWWGVLGIALQRTVTQVALHPDSDVPRTQFELTYPLADLEVV